MQERDIKLLENTAIRFVTRLDYYVMRELISSGFVQKDSYPVMEDFQRIKKEASLLGSCLIGLKIIFFFMVEQVFFPDMDGLADANSATQCRVDGGKEEKGHRKIFMFKHFLSCHKI
jgi:hypothetical protein